MKDLKKIQLQLKLKLYGYSSTGATITANQAISEIAEVLKDIPQIEDFYSLPCIRKEVFSMTKNFMEKHFQLHKIFASTEKDIANIVNKGIYSIEDFLAKSQKKISTIKPFELPVSFVNGHSMIGNTNKCILLVNNDEFLQKEPIIFDKITLGKNISTLSAGTYCHEITHTQLERQKGSTQEYTNKEVLPILIEKIFALEISSNKEVLNKSQLARFRYMLDIINYIQQLPNKKITASDIADFDQAIYIPGTLQALRLFDIYKDGSEQIRNEMLLNIQKVFDGQLTVEDLLAFYNVTYKNSQDSDLVKKHLR